MNAVPVVQERRAAGASSSLVRTPRVFRKTFSVKHNLTTATVTATVTATATIESKQFCQNMRALRLRTVPVVQERPAVEASSLLARTPRVLRRTRAIFSRPVIKHSKHTAERKKNVL